MFVAIFLICEVTIVFTTIFTSNTISIRIFFNDSLTTDFHGYVGEEFSTSIAPDLYWSLLPKFEKKNMGKIDVLV